MKASTQRVQNELDLLNLGVRVIELKQSTKTCELAAQALTLELGQKVEVGQIVKSLIFMADDSPILVLASGSTARVNEKQLKTFLNVSKLRFAKPEEVREATGFAIGGVSPFGLKQELPVYIDETLLHFDMVYCAAGTPNSMFGISPKVLTGEKKAIVVSEIG